MQHKCPSSTVVLKCARTITTDCENTCKSLNNQEEEGEEEEEVSQPTQAGLHIASHRIDGESGSRELYREYVSN